MIAVKLRVRFVEGVEVLALLLGHVPHARHMLPGKQEVLRVHETGFHEALGLLRAPARIRFVDQTTLIVQEVVEIAPGPRELLSEVFATRSEERRVGKEWICWLGATVGKNNDGMTWLQVW